MIPKMFTLVLVSRVVAPAVLGLALGVASCTSDDGESGGRAEMQEKGVGRTENARHESDREIVRGHYVFDDQARWFRPCGGDTRVLLIDRTHRLRDLHGELAYGAADTPVFLVAAGRFGPPPKEGDDTQYAASLTVEELAYAANEGFGCDFDWDRFRYRAQGNEPFWMLEVLSTEMRLTRPGHDDLIWTNVQERRTEDALVFQSGNGGHPPVELVIEMRPSRDTMSGAYYGLSARLLLENHRLKGHALRGTGPVR